MLCLKIKCMPNTSIPVYGSLVILILKQLQIFPVSFRYFHTKVIRKCLHTYYLLSVLLSPSDVFPPKSDEQNLKDDRTSFLHKFYFNLITQKIPNNKTKTLPSPI